MAIRRRDKNKDERKKDRQAFIIEKIKEKAELVKAKASRWKWFAVVIGLVAAIVMAIKGC